MAKQQLDEQFLEKGRRGLRDFLGTYLAETIERKLSAGVYGKVTLDIYFQEGRLTKAETAENTTLKPDDFVSD